MILALTGGWGKRVAVIKADVEYIERPYLKKRKKGWGEVGI